MRRIVLLSCVGMAAGCAGLDQVYLHDPELALVAAEAEASFAASASGNLWQAMRNNVQATAAAERAALARSAEQRFEGSLLNLEDLTWQELVDCGRGMCWAVSATAGFGPDSVRDGLLADESTEEKIAFLTLRIGAVGDEMAALRDKIADIVPITETSPLAVSSTVSSAIGDVETRIAAVDARLSRLKQQALRQLEDRLESVMEPVLNPFRGQRAEMLAAVRSGMDAIRRGLDAVANARALPTEAVDSIVLEFEDILPDGVPSQAKSLMLARLNELFDLEESNDDLAELLEGLDAATEAANDELGRLDGALTAALGDHTLLSDRARAVNDLLRKGEHLDLVKLESMESMLTGDGMRELTTLSNRFSLSEALERLQDTELSSEFSEALNDAVQDAVCSPCNVGDILEYLKTDESKLQAIRTRLRDDFRRTTIATLNFEIGTLERELRLLKDLLGVVQQQHAERAAFGTTVDAVVSRYGIVDLEEPVYQGLDCLARFAGETEGLDCAADTRDARNQFADTLDLLSRYFALEGDLRDQEIGLWIDIARMQHLRSIEASQIAALGHEQFIASGLQALAAFTQGGITTEQIASVLRVLNSSLLAAIAAE